MTGRLRRTRQEQGDKEPKASIDMGGRRESTFRHPQQLSAYNMATDASDAALSSSLVAPSLPTRPSPMARGGCARGALCEPRSQALWCMLGYVVGLGDRHGENILLEIDSGRVVHVDFDCLFGKGMLLPRPETVPFRLTQNCVSALGVTGIEGVFRRTCELCMDCGLHALASTGVQICVVGWWWGGKCA